MSVCAHCGHSDIIRHGTKQHVFIDCPIHGKRVGIHLERQRYRCKICGATFLDPLPDMADGRLLMTKRVVTYIQEQSLSRTFASLAEEIGVDEKTVRNIFREHVADLARKVRFETPRWMGIDEIHLTSQYRAVITNLEENTVVEILSNRNLKSVKKYFEGLKDKHSIEIVAMDMWRPYRDAVREQMPQAQIIVDRFHIQRMANEAMEKVRKSLRASLNTRERRTLKNDRFVLLKRLHDLGPEDHLKLSGWIRNHSVLDSAHALKEGFYSLWDSPSRAAAIKAYLRWQANITPDVAWAFEPIVTAVSNWYEEIFAYFDHPVTNAYTESLNNLIRVMNRIGRGYSFEALRARILYTEGIFKTKLRISNSLRSQRKSAGTMDYFMRVSAKQEVDDSLRVLNYGADIGSLISLLESGAFELP
jgi:transposase